MTTHKFGTLVSMKSVNVLLILILLVSVSLVLEIERALATDKVEEVTVHSTSTSVEPVADNSEEYVRTFFKDTPVLIDIARCESKFRQFTDSGAVFRGGQDGGMIGIFQFNENYHKADAAMLGFNLETVSGNSAYAKYLYTERGTDPWIASYSCWSNSSEQEKEGAFLYTLGSSDDVILEVQKLLNAKGYTVAVQGPGSRGNETRVFGSLTRAALRKFQCNVMNICNGSEYTNAYGLLDEKTYDALKKYVPKYKDTVSRSNETTQIDTPTNDQLLEQIRSLVAQIKMLQSILDARRAI